MFARFGLLSLLISILLCLVTISVAKKIKLKYGPGGMDDRTKCDEFAKYARFNPYSVVGIRWFLFYYWGPPRSWEIYVFTIPSANHTKHLHDIFDRKTIIPIDWSARQVLMEDHNNNTFLLIERGDRGQYWMYEILMPRKGAKAKPRDIRIKQTGDNRVIGIMDCDSGEVDALCRLDQVPKKQDLLDEASRLNYRGRKGKSYLYEGHEFGPVDEADESQFWLPEKYRKFYKRRDDSKKEVKDENNSQQSGEVTDAPSTEISNNTKTQSNNTKTQLNNTTIQSNNTTTQSNNTKTQLNNTTTQSNNTTTQNLNNTKAEESNNTNTNESNTKKVKRASTDTGNHETGDSQLTREQLDTDEVHVFETVHPRGEQDTSNAAFEFSDSEKDQGNEQSKLEEPTMVEYRREIRNINDRIESESKEDQAVVMEGTTNKDTVDPIESPVGVEDTIAPQPYEELLNSTSYEVHGDSYVTDKPYLPSNYQ